MVLGDTSGGFTLYAAHPRGLGYDPYARLFGTTSDWASLAKIPKERFQVLSLSGRRRPAVAPAPPAPACADPRAGAGVHGHQPCEPGPPLNGPTTRSVIHPP